MAEDVRLSKTLSFWLRHKPEAGGLTLDANGWTTVDAVLAGLGAAGIRCDRTGLLQTVAASDKQRFELSPDGTRIRARQGHSVAVDLALPDAPPPALLFHGTVARFLPSIRAAGLRPMRRSHVHLSADTTTARLVAARRGEPVILTVRAAALAATGQAFFVTGNGVWLTEAVPPALLEGLGG